MQTEPEQKQSFKPIVLPKKPVPDTIPPESVFAYAKKLNGKHRLAYYILYLTAARVSEILNLTKSSFTLQDIDGKKALYIRLKTLKNRRSHYRILPLLLDSNRIQGESEIIRGLWSYVNHLPEPESRVFPSKRFTRHSIKRMFARKITFWAESTNGKERMPPMEFHMHPHYLRHCRCHDLLFYYRIDAPYLVEWMGWTDAKPLQRYKQAMANTLHEVLLGV